MKQDLVSIKVLRSTLKKIKVAASQKGIALYEEVELHY